MGKYFEDIHATAQSQLDGIGAVPEDSVEVAEKRAGITFAELMELGKALCAQLRYREAIDVYTMAIRTKPDEMSGYRQRAARYLATLQPREAMLDFAKCRQLGADEQDISYRMGLCHYFAGEYEACMEEMEYCFPLCDEEMGIAAIFWHTLSAWRCSGRTVLLEEKYHSGMQVGHHTAYETVMALAAGTMQMEEMKERLHDEAEDLEFSLLAYGTAAVLAKQGKAEEAEILISEVLRRDSFWISFGYLAAWNDRRHCKRKEKQEWKTEYVSWRKRWQQAYEQASFYHSEKNSSAFWDAQAKSLAKGAQGTAAQEAGRAMGLGEERVKLLTDILSLLSDGKECKSVIDIGCGTGAYIPALAEKFEKVTALDSSEEMLKCCKETVAEAGYRNVSFLAADYMTFAAEHKFDVVVACLNPATYCPDGFDRLLAYANRYVVYMSTDQSLEEVAEESVYHGTNLIEYPYRYLEELGYQPVRIPFFCEVKNAAGKSVLKKFAYVICNIGSCRV